MPVPSPMRSVTLAAAASATNGSRVCPYSRVIVATPPGYLLVSGMCECSGTHNESKPRSSIAFASDVGGIVVAVNTAYTPYFIASSPDRCELVAGFAAECELGRPDVGRAGLRHRRIGVVAECIAPHRVSQQLLQLRIEGACDLRRARQVLVLLGAQPAEAVRDVDA